ncbi:tRNA uridine(34) 5-carboxymethylaminomethyl modification radical SAM/GNAT enzyme Elp3 [Candidatus Parcubacteria bacterium]|nr:tRNA uridine(34) 5-carboxymethylaminomethyl modification radical SAM/GNAT enzyme Elp3 [Candidatus Parcubacteria bacterium]
MQTAQAIIQKLIKDKAKTVEDLALAKRRVAKELNSSLPTNVKLLAVYHNLLREKRITKSETLEKLLIKRGIRSLSGVIVVSVLTKPYSCPGKCIYCPTEKGIPKSYLSGEPAVERAKALKYDPYLQTKTRIDSLSKQGHPIDKVELRIIGATWSSYPKQYQVWFIKECFRAANEFLADKKQPSSKKTSWPELKREQRKNEKTKCRLVGISIETRPDSVDLKEIINLRKLGVTMVEIGVQTIFDDILEKCKRGHLVEETIAATKLLKNAGFKVMYQMMPNLPGSSLKRDLTCFKSLFNDSKLKPDWLKIYPCLVCKGSELYELWKQKKYHPYTDKELTELLIAIKKIIPYWVRLSRLIRDIPAFQIEAGCKISNLREIIQKKFKEKGIRCNCIRCREVRERYNPKEKIELHREDYDASEGKEIFLSFENKEKTKLFAYLRLRISSNLLPVLKNAALVRELHTFGQMVPVGKKACLAQHKGLGKKLLKEAEKISRKEFKLNKIAVISGIGARDYFRKTDYRLKDNYMVKTLPF